LSNKGKSILVDSLGLSCRPCTSLRGRTCPDGLVSNFIRSVVVSKPGLGSPERQTTKRYYWGSITHLDTDWSNMAGKLIFLFRNNDLQAVASCLITDPHFIELKNDPYHKVGISLKSHYR
jgi:hypothetical protein